LGLRWNRITDSGVKLLAASKKLPSLLIVELHGNECQNPVEQGVRYETYTQAKILDFVELPEFGKQLQKEFGEIQWLHTPSRIRAYPMSSEWFSKPSFDSSY
jgi:hypothetical protein